MNKSIREELEQYELHFLASYALKNINSKGRKFLDKKDEFRLDFARDRDRIIHTKAFRRLKGKTQVFVSHHGDHFRSRLTHTLEVSQIARTLARIFRVNEDVVEAVALAHDLGHTPFGHAGQEILSQKMKIFSKSFEHNAQSRRILEVLEKKNLCIETLLCLYKHPTEAEKKELGGVKNNFLEGQIVDIADEIAYICHDLEDGLRAKILLPKDFDFVPNNLIDFFVKDIAKEGLKKIQKLRNILLSPDDVRNFSEKVLHYSPKALKIKNKIKQKLHKQMYYHNIVLKQTQKGKKIISDIFDFLIENPKKIPENFTGKISDKIKDFISGMTDQFAENFWKENVQRI